MAFLWFLEGLRNPLADRVMQIITCFGQELFIIAVICTLYWCVDKQFAYILGFVYFAAGLGVQVLKITFRIPRPWVLDPEFRPVESAVEGATGYSFPSGHTQGATALFFPVVLKTDRKSVKVFSVFAFLLIGFSRMYLGCHTPKDVVVSMILTIAISLLVWRLRGTLENNKYTGIISAVLAISAILVAGYALFLNGNGTIAAEYAVDCCKASGAGLGFAAGFYLEQKVIHFEPHAGSVPVQIAKLAAGLCGAGVVMGCCGILFGTSILAKALEYFILVLWVIVIYPFIVMRMCKK